MFQKYLYYGYDKDIYTSVKELRDQTNSRHTRIVVSLFLVIMLVASILATFKFIPYAHRFLYYYFMIAGAVFLIFLHAAKKIAEKYPTVFVYVTVILLAAFAILSSKNEPFQLATVFPAFMVLFGVAFIDKMLGYSIMLTGITVVFSLTSFYTKPPSTARYDLLYAIVFTGVALVFHFLFQHSRLDQFLAYHKNREIQRDLEVQSSFDILSELLMRGRFFALADSAMRRRKDDEYIALCILDLDSFKQINDRYGHQMGDKAIQTAAGLIWKELDADLSEKWSFCERAVKEGFSFAGRLGGDEFVIFLRENRGWEYVQSELQNILNHLNEVDLGEMKGICASFGVTQITPEDNDIDAVYARADAALYTAKTSGKNQIVMG